VRRNAKGQRLSCKIQHGSWVYVVDAGTVDGRRHQVKRGGYASEAAAETALHETIDQMGKGIATHDDRQTVAAYCPAGWPTGPLTAYGPKTLISYRDHIERIWLPRIGYLRLRKLNPAHIEAVLRDMSGSVSPASVRRIHATLRSALNTAVRQRVISYNPASVVGLPKAPKGQGAPVGTGGTGHVPGRHCQR
jgi:hypothetical protein